MQKNSKGITLITLAVTIIVLIILAGVSINMLVGENGIIKKAQEAKENMELAQIQEQKSLNELYWQMDNGLDLGVDFNQSICTNCILIYTKEQLIALRDRVNSGDNCKGKTIKLMNNIDLNGSENDQWIPMLEFAGTFDGNYHTIKNMYMDTNQYGTLALFTTITKEGMVKNLKLENCYLNNYYCTLTYNESNGAYYANNVVAGICKVNEGIISNIWITGQLKGHVPTITEEFPDDSRARTHLGGIVGDNNKGIIANCVNQASIEGEGIVPLSNCSVGAGVSGICNSNNGIIYNCYNTGSIKANGYNTQFAAGIAGASGETNVSQIINCYNIGNMQSSIQIGTNRCGAITAKSVAGNSTIINCHYLDTIFTTLTWSGEIAQTESTMKSDSFIQTLGAAYNKDETNKNNGYPVLNWQID